MEVVFCGEKMSFLKYADQDALSKKGSSLLLFRIFAVAEGLP